MLISDGKPIKLKDGRYRLVTDWVIILGNKVYLVPKGFDTDFASIPFPFTLLWTKDFSKPFNKAAIIHDYMHLNHVIIEDYKKIPIGYFKRQWVFLMVMIDSKEKYYNYLPIYLAVLLFSWLF